MIGEPPQAWIDTARHERDRRAERYPALVAAAKLSADTATVDYQCWCAIAGWLETGHLQAIEGGVDGQTIVDWTLAEVAAEKALTKIRAKLENVEADAEFDAERLLELQRRCANLTCIHRAVQLRRESIEIINRQLREQREEVAA